jgi:septal ring factor EnvC (AmiA/AmiB activator)
MKLCERVAIALAASMVLLLPARLLAQKGDFLSDEEEDALRDAQDPGLRIEVYLKLEQARLEHIEGDRDKPAEIHTLLSQYISLNEEMKNWIQDQYDHHGDMRKGLRALLEQGPQQLDALKQIGMWPESANSVYERDLRDATDSMTDALDGGTKAFADQQKMFGQLKREQKIEARETKEKIKEEKKRNKEEEKLRKKMERQSKSDSNEN